MNIKIREILKNVFSKTGIAALIICGIIFSISVIKIGNSFPSIAKTIKNFNAVGISNSIKNFENDYNNNYETLQKVAVDITGYAEKAQGKRVSNTPTMLLAFDTDNHLHRIMPKTDIKAKLASLKKTMLYFKNKKIKTVYTLVPSSVVRGVTVLPDGIKDYQNEYADKLLKSLNDSKIRTIDLRTEFANLGLDPQKLFFNTDHHWNIKAAFNGATTIVKYFNDNFKLDLDPNGIYSKIENYSITTYKEAFYGTYANAAGRAFVGKADDIDKILPKYETKFKFKSYTKTGALKNIDSKRTYIIGPFKDSLHNGTKTHSAYCNNARVEIIINNYKSTNELKCMVFGTSNTRIATAFLAPYFKEIRYVDTQENRFNKNIYKYVENYKPDVILFMYPAFAFTNAKTFIYNTN